tara:strand:+ start:181 stop:438 length:258 start_codon:yes stop_codon:yes gene_type:complete
VNKMAKFKVGDYTEMITPSVFESKDSRHVAHILEVITQTCEAGIEQNTYYARVWTERAGQIATVTTQMRLRQMELGEKIEQRSIK